MINLDKVYTRYELECQKPTGYVLVEKNYKKFPAAVSYDKYKIVEIISNVGVYTYVSPSHSEITIHEGIIVIEMVYPES